MSDKVNLESVAKKLKKGQYTLDELKIKLKHIRQMRDQGYRIFSHRLSKGVVYYISQEEKISHFISGASKEEQTVKWVEVSDTHAGSIAFDEMGLRSCLEQAQDQGFEDVFISGDLCDGVNVYPGHFRNLRYSTSEDQASLLAEILLDYNFNYYACKGNHDESFEKKGAPNPGVLIEKTVSDHGGKFTFFNSMCADVVICGVLKRMVHLAGGGAYAKSYPAQTYIRNLLDSHGENVWVNGNQYRVRFLQCGHFHSDVAFESAGMHVTHPGNFQFPNDFTIRRGLIGYQGCRFTTCVIKNKHVMEYQSKFVKPVKES